MNSADERHRSRGYGNDDQRRRDRPTLPLMVALPVKAPQRGSVRSLVLFDDRRGDTPPLADLDPTGLRPRADVRATLAAGSGTASTTPDTAASTRTLHERRQPITQYARVFGTEIDFISDPVDGERHRLRGFAAIQVIDKALNDLLSHIRPFHNSFPETI